MPRKSTVRLQDFRENPANPQTITADDFATLRRSVAKYPALLAKRQKDILAFCPEPYREVRATFSAAAGSYEARWYDPEWRKDETAPQRTRERIWDAEAAEAIVRRCKGKQGEVTEVKKPVSMPAPLLFDLTSLQKEASNRYGFSARRTL